MTDLSSFKDLYIKTAKENLQALKNGLFLLEQNGNDEKAIEEVFRNAHTLKSKSLLMGFDKISDLAKSIEDKLYEARNKKTSPTKDVLETITNKALQIEKLLAQI